MEINLAVVFAIKSNGGKKKKFANVRGDVIGNKKLTDIEVDTIEARVTLGNLMGFDYDPSEAHDEQTP